VDALSTPEEEHRMARTVTLIGLALALAVVCAVGIACWALWRLAQAIR
jgi:hypothetical protein